MTYFLFEQPFKTNGHAIFWEPPSRASLGKQNQNFCNVPINDQQDEVWCGGLTVIVQQFRPYLI